jgi:transglutaminase-like putative cysteine protease
VLLKATCEMTLQASARTPIIAMLRPRSGQGQWVSSESYLLEPRVPVVEYVDGFGNLCQRLVAPEGKFHMRVTANVDTPDDIAIAPGAAATAVEQLPDCALQYLLPSRYCPSDLMEEDAKRIAGKSRPGYDQVETIRAWIHENVEYRYGASTASTNAQETLRDRAGVCRDFSHLGMTLSRALRIPARMVVGYLYQLDPMDMHAWFEAFVDGRWYTFDATQTKPRGGRITVAYGRDAADVALFSEYGPIEVKKMHVDVELDESV